MNSMDMKLCSKPEQTMVENAFLDASLEAAHNGYTPCRGIC